MSSAYRPHLDGIRAVAVIMVLLFHLGYGWISGGFIGVDVFFVLSGYLITGILLGEATSSGTVRLSRFYARRARRLLPASILVLFVVMAVGRWVLDPIQVVDLGIDATWSALYAANWRFGLAGGEYFAPGDVPSALVHYWSLAVEEQFYLVWPALFLALHRGLRRWRGDRALPALMAVVTGLLLISAWTSIRWVGDPLTYYGTHSRAYQLLAGALLVLVVRHRDLRLPAGRRGQVVGGLLSVSSLGLLGLLAHRIPDASHYPGWTAVVVTLASVALIVGLDLAPAGAPASRALGAAAPAFIGRLSYSIYIWHWPIIVLLPLVAERLGHPDGLLSRNLDAVVVTAVVAGVGHVLVERPMRYRVWSTAPPLRVVGVGLAASLTVVVVAYPMHHTDDPLEQQALRAVRDNASSAPCPYFADEWAEHPEGEPCTLREGEGPTIAVVGDSHAQMWQPALVALADELDATLVLATYRGCPPNDITPVTTASTGQTFADGPCTAWRRATLPTLAATAPDLIFVATGAHTRGIESDDGTLEPGTDAHLDAWTDGWDWTLDTLTAQGSQVVVSTVMPALPEATPACLLDRGEGAPECDVPLSADGLVPAYSAAVEDLARADGSVRVIDPVPLVCPHEVCPAMIDGEIVHRDDDHITASFSESLAPALQRLLVEAGAPLGG